MRRETTVIGAATLGILLTATAALGAGYVAGTTFVVQSNTAGNVLGTQTPLDNGALVCRQSTGSGIGGACLRWGSLGPGEEFVRVLDESAGPNVAFQVCIDNDGDQICGGDSLQNPCRDDIFFSHDDQGNFFNPLGPLPQEFAQGCPGGFPGWLVFLCQGTHETNQSQPHQHPVTAGSISATTDGAGYGTFCGGGPLGDETADPKPYFLAP